MFLVRLGKEHPANSVAVSERYQVVVVLQGLWVVEWGGEHWLFGEKVPREIEPLRARPEGARCLISDLG